MPSTTAKRNSKKIDSAITSNTSLSKATTKPVTAKKKAGKDTSASRPTCKTTGATRGKRSSSVTPLDAAVAAKKTTKADPVATVVSLTPEQRRCYIEVAAYYIAERRAFLGTQGSEFDDWVEAEKEVERLLQEGILPG